MKRLIRPALTSILIVLGIVLSGAAMADRGGGHRGGHWRGHGGGHWGGHTSLGFYFGLPLFGPAYYPAPYYYPPAYYPPTVVVPSSPPVYIEQDNAQPAPESSRQDWWYYCAESNTYYPYVKQCPGGWQRVTPQPPSG
jgi:hypothetical protein